MALILLLVAGVLAAMLFLPFALARSATAARNRDEIAHAREVADAVGGAFVSDEYGPRVELTIANLRCTYGSFHMFPPGFYVMRALLVEVEWTEPSFGIWRRLWIRPHEDASGSPYQPFQDLEPLASEDVNPGWGVLGEAPARAIQLWKHVHKSIAKVLPYLDGVSATHAGGLRLYFRDPRPPPQTVADAIGVVRVLCRSMHPGM